MHSAFWKVATTFLFLPMIVQAQDGSPVPDETITAALPKLEHVVKQLQNKTGVPGIAVAVVHEDRVAYLKGFGVCQVGKDQRVNADTVFQLASISKPISSTLLALLVSLGIIDWDDLLVDHFPDFQLADPWVTRQVTIRDMLCHRSGLPEHAGDLLEDLGYDQTQIFHRLRFLKPASSIRSKFAYTNFPFSLACVAAARKTGKRWEDLIAEKLFRPLGMKSTSARFADYIAADNRAVLHAHEDGKWVAKYVRKPDAQAPAGGVSSSARDMAQWLRLQLAGGKFNGKQLIESKALTETHGPQIVSQPPTDARTERAGFYGLGWNVNYDSHGNVRLSHSGAFDMGAATAVLMSPAEGYGILVLTNGAPIGVPEALCATFVDLVQTGKVEHDWYARFGKVFKAMEADAALTDYSKPRAKKLSPLPAKAYSGVYHNAYFGELNVVEKQGEMYLLLGPKQTAFVLRHWDRDTYTYRPAGEMATGLSGVFFDIGPDNRAMSVTLEHLNVHGTGRFTRRITKAD